MIKLEKVFERDVDLLIINKFINDSEVLEYFLRKVGLDSYKLFSVEHSHMDNELGESDITAIVEKNGYKVGILIEDKIDAIAMDLQPERYVYRGERGIKKGDYDEYKIFIIAPEKYLSSNAQAKKYPNRISYEELVKVIRGDAYAVAILEKAIAEKESGYTVIENEMVTNFWKNYYKFIRENYPKIKIHEVEGPRGVSALWPEMSTDYKQVTIIHKSERGFMDLTFKKMAENVSTFNKYTEKLVLNDFKVVETGKSLSIRLEVPVVDFRSEFNNYVEEMHECMNSAMKLYELLGKINVLMMYDEIKK